MFSIPLPFFVCVSFSCTEFSLLVMVTVLDPVTGALVHNCGSVFVIVNPAFLLGWTS